MKQRSKQAGCSSLSCCRCAKPILLVVVVTLFASTLLAVPIRAIALLVSPVLPRESGVYLSVLGDQVLPSQM